MATTGVTITGNGTGRVTLSGSSANITTALNGLSYSPTADYYGSDALTVTTTNGTAPAVTSTTAITVTPVADIVADTLTTNQNTALTANLITGTNGASADSFENTGRSLSAVTQGAHGSVTFLADGTVTYTPTTGWTGTDSFTYTVSSGGMTETATVNVSVVNQAPVVNAKISANANLYQSVVADSSTESFVTVRSGVSSTINGVRASVTETLNYDQIVNYSPPWGSGYQSAIIAASDNTLTWNFTGTPLYAATVYLDNVNGTEWVQISVNGSLLNLQTANRIADTYSQPDIVVNTSLNRLEYTGTTAQGAGIYRVTSQTAITSLQVTAGNSSYGARADVYVSVSQLGATITASSGVALSTLAPATDANVGSSIHGYAITGAAAETTTADSTPGKWQYYDGTAWVDISTSVSASAALFLTASTKVRWSDNDNTHTALSMVAVDDTSTATQGSTLDVSTRGGTTPYSANIATLAAGTGPVVIDANHDGAISYGRTVMDVNGDGVLDSTAWAGKGDGVLVWNRYGDGQVHDSSQYAFGQQFGGTDLQGLAKGFDSNHDGVFDATDEAFSQFGVWVDSNSDGKVEAGEFKTLADLGIASINLSSDGVTKNVSADVMEYGRTTASTSNGDSLRVVDASFSYDTADSALQNATTTQLATDAHVHGSTGVDVFAWSLNNATPTSGAIPTATIDNFDMRITAAGGDVLDLRDLLAGESHSGTDAGNLANYLHFSASGSDTTIAIKSSGPDVTQNLVLKGVDLTALGSNDTAIIHDLLTKGKLITD